MTSPIKRVRFSAHHFSLELSSGMTISYPLIWFSQLENSKIEDLKKCKIIDSKVVWPALGCELSLHELLQIYGNSDTFRKPVDVTLQY